jgi:hypothetical protein
MLKVLFYGNGLERPILNDDNRCRDGGVHDAGAYS